MTSRGNGEHYQTCGRKSQKRTYEGGLLCLATFADAAARRSNEAWPMLFFDTLDTWRYCIWTWCGRDVRHMTGERGRRGEECNGRKLMLQPFSRYPLGILTGQSKPQGGSTLKRNLNLSLMLIHTDKLCYPTPNSHEKSCGWTLWGQENRNYHMGNTAHSELFCGLWRTWSSVCQIKQPTGFSHCFKLSGGFIHLWQPEKWRPTPSPFLIIQWGCQ